MAGSVNNNLLASLRSRIADDRPGVQAFTLSATGEAKSAIVEITSGVLMVSVEGGTTVDRITWNLLDPKYSTTGRLINELKKARGYKVVEDPSYASDHPSIDLSVSGLPDISKGGSASFKHRLYSDAEMTNFIMEAVSLHNPNYANLSAVPATERAYVLLKASAIVYRALAADTVRRRHMDADAKNLIALAQDLESQYEKETNRLHRVIPSPKADESRMGAGDIVVGRMTRLSLRTGAKAALRDAVPPTPPKLFDPADDDVEDVNIRLRWSQNRDEHHSHYEVWRDTQSIVERTLAGRLTIQGDPQTPPQTQYSRAGTSRQVLGTPFNATPVFDGFFFWTAAEAQAGTLVNCTFIDGKVLNNVGASGSSALGEPLEPETDYYFRVYVVNRNGELAPSEVKHFRTKAMRARLKRSGLAITGDAMSVRQGPLAGGTALTILGTNFVEGMQVLINGKPCTSLAIVNANTLTCLTPGFTNTDWIGEALNLVLKSPTGLVDIYQYAWKYTP